MGAIERPDGLLIERLLDSGLRLRAVHPNPPAAMRPRFTAAGTRSDSFDAFLLAELARTDAHRFRVLVADSDATKALRALSRAREDARRHQGVRRHRQPDRAGLTGRAEHIETEARRQIVLALVAAPQPAVAQIADRRADQRNPEIRVALADQTDGPTFRSLFATHRLPAAHRRQGLTQGVSHATSLAPAF